CAGASTPPARARCSASRPASASTRASARRLRGGTRRARRRHDRVTARSAVRWTLAAFAAISILFSGAFPPFANPNELSRYEAVVAAWDHHTFAIDAVVPVLGDHEDKSLSGGKTYSNKAPGLAFAAIPVYALLRIALPPPAAAAAPIFWILRILTV